MTQQSKTPLLSAPPENSADDEGTEASPNDTQPRWRPLSLTAPILLCTMAVTIILAVIVEILAQASQRWNGLASYPSPDQIPTRVAFAYRYLPTLIATLYSLLWYWIDLDVKQIQPWVELSKPGGAIAESSILLDYPSKLLVKVPVLAAKQRHWMVFISATVMVLVLTALTPLQSAVFGDSTVLHTMPSKIVSRSRLLPVSEQSESIRFIHLAYTTEQLNQSYPSFTTQDYALLPFYLDDIEYSDLNVNWTAETTKLWAEVNCSSADYKYVPTEVVPGPTFRLSSGYYKFTTAAGCTADITFTMESGNKYPAVAYCDRTGYHRCLSCPKPNSPYSALVYWVNMTARDSADFTALQCDVTYYKQQVKATVDSKSFKPIDETIEPISERKRISTAEFNSTSYTNMFPLGVWSSNKHDFGDGLYPANSEFNSDLDFDLDIMLGYFADRNDYTADIFSDPHELESLVRRAHKQMFSLEISSRLGNDTSTSGASGTSTVFLTTIVVSRVFAAILEALLLLAALAVGLIWYFVSISNCALHELPSSIGGLVDMTQGSPEVARLFQTLDTADEDLMVHALGGIRFKLITECESKRNKIVVIRGASALSDERHDSIISKPYYKPVKPWILRRVTGIVFIVVLLTAIIILSYLKSLANKQNGLRRPSENFLVRQILENYVPTAFSTLIEPFWILLARTMCIFQPFKDLWKGKSPAARSISAQHASIPPQLALFSAISARHILLSLLCFAALLANLLAIGLSALFNEQLATVEFSQQYQSTYRLQLDSSELDLSPGNSLESAYSQDFLFVPLTNSTYHSQLSPWISPEYYFQPLTIIGVDKNRPGDEYILKTRGFGVDANCTSIPPSQYRLHEDEKNSKRAVSNSTDDISEILSSLVWRGLLDPVNESASAVLSYSDIYPGNDWSRYAPLLTFGMSRAPDGVGDNKTITTSYFTCQPFLQTGMFEVTVDSEGHVIRYKQNGHLQSSLGYANSTIDSRKMFYSLNDFISKGVLEAWRTDSLTTDWVSHFLYLDTGSRDVVDPKLPVPDPAKLIPSAKRVYSRLFASLLGTNSRLLVKTEDKSLVTGKRITQETRIFMDNTAFIITIVVLSLDIIIALVFYVPESLYILPRLPSTIGSIIAYIAPSRLVRDGASSFGWRGQTFSFGRYIGYDDKAHVGIERDPHVFTRDISLGSYNPIFQPSPKTTASSSGIDLARSEDD